MLTRLPIMLLAYPEIFLLAAGCAILVIDPFLKDARRWVSYALSLAALLGCAVLTTIVTGMTGGQLATTFNGMFVSDMMASTLKMFTYIVVALCLVYSRVYMAERGLYRGEYFALALFATLGMMVMISANHFLTLYLGLELMSLCLYSLVALNRDSAVSSEAAMKYFVLGAIMSMIYGVTGTLEITEVARGAARVLQGDHPSKTVLAFGLVFVVSGLAFKVGVVPFHMWIPDVYHGAPSAVTLFISTGPKLAAFAMAIRLLVNALQPLSGDTPQFPSGWQDMLVVLSLLSMAIGNLAAIAQSNIKRMLAYSTISHMGFMLLGLLSGIVGGNALSAAEAWSSAMFYAVVYVLMSLGSFGMVVFLSRAGFEAERIEDFRGLNARSPWFAFIMLLLMFSLAGIPPTVGFYAKLSVLQAVLGAGHVWLALVAVLFALVGT
ncbi:MAG: NADH-quinone oxidoreductase subunit NuoN, partial [Betaproteobacteria bacterium]